MRSFLPELSHTVEEDTERQILSWLPWWLFGVLVLRVSRGSCCIE